METEVNCRISIENAMKYGDPASYKQSLHAYASSRPGDAYMR